MPNIKFGSVDFSGDGAYIWGAGEFSAPSRSIEVVNVPGRNGDVIFDNGNYNNTTATYSVIVTRDIERNTNRLKYLLYSQKGYQKLYDSDRKGFYREAYFADGFEIASTKSGVVTVVFNCKPFWRDINGDTAIEFVKDSVLFNQYFENSRPKIEVFGNGSGNVFINHQNVYISNIDTSLTIDCETQDAYKDGENKNSTINTADIELLPDKNNISFSGGITSVKITPRWVTI